MPLTAAQKTTLKTYILADPVLGPLAASSSVYEISLALSENVPSFIVWKTKVTWDEIMENGMDFTRVDNLTNGSKWRIWEWLFKNSSNAINPSKVNHRAGIDAAWVGTAADLAVRAQVYTHCKRSSNLAEKILASGPGTDANPATMTFEGDVTLNDVIGVLA
jgi:hypothetical protein